MSKVLNFPKQNNVGVAVDVGTTTIGISCVDLYSHEEIISYLFKNPQGRYGADVITRIKTCIDDSGMLNTMSEMLTETIYKTLKTNLGQKYNNISDVCFSGNTTMLHILRGLSVEGLAAAPFNPVTLDLYQSKRVFDVSDENINEVNSNKTIKEIYLPGFSAFVGADILSGAAYLGMGKKEKYDLLIDLGTNGELLLINKDRGYATSTACGPVFDHGVIGAIYGSECIHGIAASLRSGIIDKTGLIKGIFFDKGIELDNRIIIKQEHVRRFQMAKAAIYAGVLCLMEKAGIDYDDIGNVYISGGLGFYMDVMDAFTTRLIPKELRGKITVSGNTSLLGAQMFIMAYEGNNKEDTGYQNTDNVINDHKDRKREMLSRTDITEEYDGMRVRTEAFELADYDGFQDIYINSMNF